MNDSFYLDRCLSLAALGGSRVFPNPLVGAVLVAEDRIIGEGYHQSYGGPHAEVAAVQAALPSGKLEQSVLYVSLEPCNHHGHTPPCTDLIIRHRIPRVVVGCLDPNPKVAGRGVKRLREAGVEVRMAPDPAPFVYQNRYFFLNQKQKRAFVTLKWAQTQDGFIGGLDENGQPVPVAITGFEANTRVHQLRATHQAILVGRRTAQVDDPRLTTRRYYGENPNRIILDRHRKVDFSGNLGNGEATTICLNQLHAESTQSVNFVKWDPWPDLPELTARLYTELGIGNVLVEGGREILQQFLDHNLADEIWVFSSLKQLKNGVPAPTLPASYSFREWEAVGRDMLGKTFGPNISIFKA